MLLSLVGFVPEYVSSSLGRIPASCEKNPLRFTGHSGIAYAGFELLSFFGFCLVFSVEIIAYTRTLAFGLLFSFLSRPSEKLSFCGLYFDFVFVFGFTIRFSRCNSPLSFRRANYALVFESRRILYVAFTLRVNQKLLVKFTMLLLPPIPL
jgi:hypothetical protein